MLKKLLIAFCPLLTNLKLLNIQTPNNFSLSRISPSHQLASCLHKLFQFVPSCYKIAYCLLLKPQTPNTNFTPTNISPLTFRKYVRKMCCYFQQRPMQVCIESHILHPLYQEGEGGVFISVTVCIRRENITEFFIYFL